MKPPRPAELLEPQWRDGKFPLCERLTLDSLARSLEAEANVLVVTKTGLARRLLLRGRGEAVKTRDENALGFRHLPAKN